MLYEKYLIRLAAAYIRGIYNEKKIKHHLSDIPLLNLTDEECMALINHGIENSINIQRFKRSDINRVNHVISILKGLRPESVLDTGSGCGFFINAFLDNFPGTDVTATDIDERHVYDFRIMRNGGIENLSAVVSDASASAFADSSFDIVCMLEVLEHLEKYKEAVSEACRAAKRYITISVPSREDSNPHHINRFTRSDLENLLARDEIKNVQFSSVLNHLVAIAVKRHE